MTIIFFLHFRIIDSVLMFWLRHAAFEQKAQFPTDSTLLFENFL